MEFETWNTLFLHSTTFICQIQWSKLWMHCYQITETSVVCVPTIIFDSFFKINSGRS